MCLLVAVIKVLNSNVERESVLGVLSFVHCLRVCVSVFALHALCRSWTV